MISGGGNFKLIALVMLMAAVAGCYGPAWPGPPGRAAPPQSQASVSAPSEWYGAADSRALVRHYRNLQSDLLDRGLLRRDGHVGGTQLRAGMLARAFETVVFNDEYASGGNPWRRAGAGAGALRRWSEPVRMTVAFGPGVPPAQAAADRMLINAYARRLARVTGHPVSTVRSGGNFHVVFASQDDRAWLRRRLSEWLPGNDPRTYKVFDRPPRSIRCLVVALASTSNPHVYTRAVALIRSELPDLMRSGCIHEELAQGLGAANDSPHAHPSVFNDDDAFALLTGHDEALLGMLYDPRLEPGMSAHQARPLVRKLAHERLRQAP